MHRIFLAILLDDSIREKITNWLPQLDFLSGFKKVPYQNWHITIKFLGSVSEKYLSKLVLFLPEKLKGFHSFSLIYEGLGVFPSIKNPRVFWIGVKKNPFLEQVYERIDKVTSDKRKQRVKPDYSFHPHITLGRWKKRISFQEEKKIQKILAENEFNKWGEQEVEEICLMESFLSRKGAEYNKYASFTLN